MRIAKGVVDKMIKMVVNNSNKIKKIEIDQIEIVIVIGWKETGRIDEKGRIDERGRKEIEIIRIEM